MFRQPPPRQRRPHPLLRVIAASCAGLVWLLGLFAANPEMHGLLHGHEGHAGACHHEDESTPPDAEHSCAVTLFQHGLESPLACDCSVGRPVARVVAGLTTAAPSGRRATDLRLHFGQAPPSC